MTIQQFIKLSFEEKSNLICSEGNLIDAYKHELVDVKVFSLYNFYVEVILNAEEEKISDIIPYARGFSFFSKKKELLNKSAALINSFFLL
ncbi:MAG: hypothetical protein IPJ32_19135 [Sphingobacteriaceae bacterium]|nr:hypothetical protein [Sphingobacteriaceae bacterium]